MRDYRVGYVNSDGEAVAVFIDSAADCNPGMLLSYARIGEHGEAAFDWIREQPLAHADQYAELHKYLGRRYVETPGEEPLNLVIDQAAVPR
jgi:hypothetical protein